MNSFAVVMYLGGVVFGLGVGIGFGRATHYDQTTGEWKWNEEVKP